MRFLHTILRYLCGLVFVFSGFVKAIDPHGTDYKIQDYLDALCPSFPQLQGLALPASITLSMAECTLGVLLLFGIYRRITYSIFVGVMLVLTPFTLWLALSNPVSDCGCFGDAITLTNWQTFWKNVALLGCAFFLLLSDFQEGASSRTRNLLALGAPLVSLSLSAYCLWDLPLLDFRPYHIGADIKAGMVIPSDAPPAQYETSFLMEKAGEQRIFTLENYPDSSWHLVSRTVTQISEGYVSPIHDFTLVDLAGKNLTDSILSVPIAYLLILPHVESASQKNVIKLHQLYDESKQHGVPFYAVTASTGTAIQQWQSTTQSHYPILHADATTLKTIIRSNPGLIELRKGVVTGKWSHNHLPSSLRLSSL